MKTRGWQVSVNRYYKCVGHGVSLYAGWGRQEGLTLVSRAGDHHNNTLRAARLFGCYDRVHAQGRPAGYADRRYTSPKTHTRGACTVIFKHEGGVTAEVTVKSPVTKRSIYAAPPMPMSLANMRIAISYIVLQYLFSST